MVSVTYPRKRTAALALVLFAVTGCGDDAPATFEPVATVSATPERGPAPLTVTFDGSASRTIAGQRSFQWDLGDGTVDDREQFEHTYTVPGYYRVTLAVTDSAGVVGTDSAEIFVSADRPLSIAGTATAFPNMVTDGDTNNPRAPNEPNDERADAQPMPSPGIAGGFLAATPTGRPGDRFESVPDEVDSYVVELGPSQTVLLSIADWVPSDPSRVDFDLFVFDAVSGSPVADSMGDGQFEAVLIPSAGRYHLVVMANNGFSNYTLSVGLSGSTPGARALSTSSELLPGEVVVTRPRVPKGASTSAEPLGFEVLVEGGGDLLLGKLPPAPSLKSGGRSAALAASPVAALGAWANGISDAQLEALHTLYEVKRLRARSDIEHAEPNYVLRPTLEPDDTQYPTQWHYPLIGLPQVWDFTTGSSDVIVAVVDTGVFVDHVDLQGKLIPGYDFISDADRARDGDGIDPNPDDPGDGQELERSSYHGTHVAGTVGAQTDNTLGVAGVSWFAQVMPVRALGIGGGSTFDVLEGVKYAAGLENSSGTLPPRRADIINLSLGGSGFSQATQDAYTQITRDLGVIVVSAAGNDGISEPFYPASYDGVVSVSAVGPTKLQAPYSNFGMFIDVAAPGGDMTFDLDGDGLPDGILSTHVKLVEGVRESAVRLMQGTSMASPHMAGVAALMKSIYADLSPVDLDALLARGSITEDLGDRGRDDIYGNGLIDGVRAVSEAARLAGGGDLPSVLTASPSLLIFQSTVEVLTLEVTQVGADPLSVNEIIPSDEWVQVIATPDVDGAGLGTYEVRVDRDGLEDGAYISTLTLLASNGQSSTITAFMRVGAPGGPGDAGLVFVELLDASNTEDILDIVEVGTGGVHPYSFMELEAGIYYVAAGTDNDNDGDLCDEGEACGAYATLSLPDQIRLSTDDIAGRDFLIGYRPDFLAAQAAGGAPPLEGIRSRH